MAVKTGVIAIALGLAGCGGGGADGGAKEGGPVAVTPAAPRTVQGTAAKGLIKGAKVSLYAIDAQGVVSATALMSTNTGNDGTFKLQVPATVLNFVIEVSAAPGAMMADEATGTDLPMAEGMKLRSIVTLAENAGATYEGTVSPLTEMVARTAQTADGKLPQAAIAQAKAGVRILMGFDPETVKPVNSNSAAAATATEDEKNQSLALAALSKMASTATADCGQNTPGERISCVVGKFTGGVVVKDGQASFDQNRLAQFRDAIQAVAEDKQINRTGKDSVGNIPVLKPGLPVPLPNPVAKTPVEATKALFGSLRTNLQAIGQGEALRATADGVKADLDDAVAPFGNDVGRFATLVTNVLDSFDRYRSGEAIPATFGVYSSRTWHTAWGSALARPYRLYDMDGTGSCEITQSPLRMRCTVVQLPFLPGATGYYDPSTRTYLGTHVYATRVLTVEPKEGSAHDYNYTVFFAKRVVNVQNGVVTGIKEVRAIGAPASGELHYERGGDAFSRVAIKGRMPGRVNRRGELQSDYEDWSLDVSRTVESGSAELYKFGGTFTAYPLASTGQAPGTIEVDPASYLRMTVEPNDVNVMPSASNALLLKARGSVGSTAVNGTLRMSGDKADKSGTAHMPTRLSFEGSLEHKGATVFSGNVGIVRGGYENFDATAPESDTNFVADSIEIGGTLSVPNRPTLGLSLAATRTAKDAADISAQYRDGTSVINASVTAKVGERHPLVKVSSAEGVAFSFSDLTAPVQVTKDGAVVAQIDVDKGIITYRDGTTESLK